MCFGFVGFVGFSLLLLVGMSGLVRPFESEAVLGEAYTDAINLFTVPWKHADRVRDLCLRVSLHRLLILQKRSRDAAAWLVAPLFAQRLLLMCLIK